MGSITEGHVEQTACPFCKGTGRCAKCDGSGSRLVRMGLFSRLHEFDCRACEGTGTCQLCHGVAMLRSLGVRPV